MYEFKPNLIISNTENKNFISKIETKKSFCCFNSKLAKVIHEQGRPQLKSFANSPFGSASNPNCRGFTPEEFQNLDFSKIDLSEWYSEIEVVNQWFNDFINIPV